MSIPIGRIPTGLGGGDINLSQFTDATGDALELFGPDGARLHVSIRAAEQLGTALRHWSHLRNLRHRRETLYRLRVFGPRQREHSPLLLDDRDLTYEEAQRRGRDYFEGSEEKELCFNISPEDT